jgi:transcriptional regulator with XRE-family HTH domain
MIDEQNQRISLADLLKLLFVHIRKPNGRTYTVMEVADASGIKYESIRAIKLGRSLNPSLNTLLPLAKFFGVSLSYFEAETKEAALDIINQEIKVIPLSHRYAFRIANLSESAQRDIVRVLAWIEEADAARQRGESPDKNDPDLRVFKPQKQ